jgi:hypothetical protein
MFGGISGHVWSGRSQGCSGDLREQNEVASLILLSRFELKEYENRVNAINY